MYCMIRGKHQRERERERERERVSSALLAVILSTFQSLAAAGGIQARFFPELGS